MSTKVPATVAPKELAGLIDQHRTIRLLDVRTTAEFERTHIAGSYNVPLNELYRRAERLAAAHAPIVLICRSGHRAHAAEDALRRACVGTVSVLDGGMLAWRRHGLPVLGIPLSPAAIVRRFVGVIGLGLGALMIRDNPVAALAIAFFGLRLALGQSLMPCAVGGTCAVEPDFDATVEALVAGRPMHEAARVQNPAPPLPAGASDAPAE